MKKRMYLLSFLTCFISTANAALFYQVNQEAAGLGDAASGKAAEASDASTEFNNPAGLVQIPDQQLVMGSNVVWSRYDYDGSSLYVDGDTARAVSGSADSAGPYVVPYLHYAAPISDQWSFGFGVSTPYKMSTDWGSDTVVSTVAEKTELSATDISTDLAYRPVRWFSLGVGYDAVRIAASDYNNQTPYNGGLYTTDSDSYSWSRAWHAGIMLFMQEQTRLGLAYHSPINFTTQGDASVLSSDGQVLSRSTSYKMEGTLPATATLSLFHQLNERWAVQTSLGFEQWQQFSDLTYYNVPTATGLVSQEMVDYHLKNTWRSALGIHYVLNPSIMLRTGVAYETSPVTDDTAYLQAPSDEIYTLSAGVHVVRSKEWAFDFGWSHLFYTDQQVDTTQSQNDTTLNGTIESSSDILGASFTWNMR